MHKLEGPPTTDIAKFKITEFGMAKLLNKPNVDKASGPPNLCYPFFKDIFEHQTGKLPIEADVGIYYWLPKI